MVDSFVIGFHLPAGCGESRLATGWGGHFDDTEKALGLEGFDDPCRGAGIFPLFKKDQNSDIVKKTTLSRKRHCQENDSRLTCQPGEGAG